MKNGEGFSSSKREEKRENIDPDMEDTTHVIER